MMNLNKFGLIESIAVIPVVCDNCLDEIDIGDDCYINRLDQPEGTKKEDSVEEDMAEIYCASCVEEF
jgi:hypothetical protein